MVEFNEPIGFLERLKYKLKIIKPFPPYSEIETKESNNQRKPWELTQEQLDNTGKHRETVVQSNSKIDGSKLSEADNDSDFDIDN